MSETTKLQTQDLWAKYEDITMHFNNLLMQLRTRSLAGVAAISTFVGIFSDKANSDPAQAWLIAASLFIAMALFWIAIFCLDFFYYNKLLSGAVTALTQLEAKTMAGEEVACINLSTEIEREFSEGRHARATNGVFAFYGIVFLFLIAGSALSLKMYNDQSAPVATTNPAKVEQKVAQPSPSATPS